MLLLRLIISMKTITTPQTAVLLVICQLFMIVIGTNISFAQDTATAQKQSLNYFKIEIGMHIIDCPVLPRCLQDKLMTLNGIKDCNKNIIKECIMFNIPSGAITKEQIISIAIGCSFPKEAINVLVDTKPFAN